MSQRLLMKRLLSSVYINFKPVKNCLFSRANAVKHVNHYCTNSQHFSKGVAPMQSVDLLMQNLNSATDTTDVLYNVQQHHAIMNEVHIMQALQSIFNLQKSQNSSVTNGELIDNTTFHLLCKVLQNKIRYLDHNDHLTALKVMSFVGVPATHKIMQILLQLIAKQVNNYTLQQIIFIDFIIKDLQSCPLVDALKIALPIVFEAHFKLQKTGCSFKQLSELFLYATKRRLSDNCIDSFVEMFNENRHELDLDTSKNIVKTIFEIKSVGNLTSYRNLLHQTLDKIVDNINSINFNDLHFILTKVANNFNNKNVPLFYHEEFVNSCADYVVNNKCNDEQVCFTLRNCNKQRHVHKGILDYINSQISDNPSRIDNWSIGMIFSYVNSLSIADYRPYNFEMFEDKILNAVLKFTNKVELPWLRFALDLCSLDCWPEELLKRILDEKFLDKFLARNNQHDCIELLQLNQVITTMFPSYQGPLPSPGIIKRIISNCNYNGDRSPLLPALLHGLGGVSYLCTPVTTKLGHIVDHAVVMRKGGYPVSINRSSIDITKTPTLVDELPVPNDSQMILIMYLDEDSYSVNIEKMIGNVRISINTLEAMGFPVVPVLHGVWENLVDNEKIPYIMQALQNKCQDQENVVASRNGSSYGLVTKTK